MNDGLFRDPGAIAAHVDREWREAFIVELRLLDVSGARIGDELMTVDTHVRESGETAQEAFGDPRHYARDIAARTSAPRAGGSVVFGIGNLLGLGGLFLTVNAVDGWRTGGVVPVYLGSVVSFAGVLAIAVVLFLLFARFARAVMDRPWWIFVIAFLGVGAVAALPTLLLRQHLTDVPALALALAGVALLAVSSVIGYREAGGSDDIVAPGRVSAGRGRSARIFVALAMPVATVIALLLGYLPTLFT